MITLVNQEILFSVFVKPPTTCQFTYHLKKSMHVMHELHNFLLTECIQFQFHVMKKLLLYTLHAITWKNLIRYHAFHLHICITPCLVGVHTCNYRLLQEYSGYTFLRRKKSYQIFYHYIKVNKIETLDLRLLLTSDFHCSNHPFIRETKG